jgi:DNA polymerase
MIQSERQRRAYLNALGIDLWVPRAADDADTCDAEPEHASPVDALDWDSLRDAVTTCTRCELCKTRTQTVFGVGNLQADWMIIGEAPGAEEDRRGEPFVGRAGKLLDEMLRAVGLDREQAFIANILKCRPPNNRDPKPDESAACRAYLERQIQLVQPKIILAVGRIAAQLLLNTDTPVGRLRGSAHQLMIFVLRGVSLRGL